MKYPFSTQQEVPERIQDADVIIVNKIQVNEASIGAAKNLKLVCVTATGTNNLDKEYLDKRGIAWRNVAGYSTESVAQHTFAMLFYLLEHLRYYDDYVKEDHYTNDTIFTHFAQTFYELKGKIWGHYRTWKYRTQSSCDCRSFWCASHLCFPIRCSASGGLPSGFS